MDLPKREEPKPKPAGWFSLLLAAGVGIMILLALVMLSGGYLALVIFVAGGVFAMAAFHYLVWGRWLSEKIYREEAAAEVQAAEAARQHEELPATAKLLGKYFRLIFWGLIVVAVSLKVNGVDLWPRGIGYLMFAFGCHGLASESVHFSVAAALAWLNAGLWLCLLFVAFSGPTDPFPQFYMALTQAILSCGLIWEMLGGVRDFALARGRPDLAAKASNRRIAYAMVMAGCMLAAWQLIYSQEKLPAYAVVAVGLIVTATVLHLVYRAGSELT